MLLKIANIQHLSIMTELFAIGVYNLTTSCYLDTSVFIEIDLGKRKLCERFSPHSLTPEQREDRVTSCQDIFAVADADKNFFNKIITGNVTWCFACDPEIGRESSEWVG